MTNAECATLLEWALPHLGLRSAGFRNVRGQVCKRIRRRIVQLGLSDVAAYRARLEVDDAEWTVLDRLCVITISRFYRDMDVWARLREDVLPEAANAALAARDPELRCWSIGCASGEEPYTLAIVWSLALAHRFPGMRLRVLATDLDERVLERARVARYLAGTLRDLPPSFRGQAFEADDDGSFVLRDRFRESVELRREDVRLVLPDETFRLVLCRNVLLTYFGDRLEAETLGRVSARLVPGGALVVGRHERLPPGAPFEPWHPSLGIHRYAPDPWPGRSSGTQSSSPMRI